MRLDLSNAKGGPRALREGDERSFIDLPDAADHADAQRARELASEIARRVVLFHASLVEVLSSGGDHGAARAAEPVFVLRHAGGHRVRCPLCAVVEGALRIAFVDRALTSGAEHRERDA